MHAGGVEQTSEQFTLYVRVKAALSRCALTASHLFGQGDSRIARRSIDLLVRLPSAPCALRTACTGHLTPIQQRNLNICNEEVSARVERSGSVVCCAC